MNSISRAVDTSNQYACSADTEVLRVQINRLTQDVVATAFSLPILKTALAAGVNETALVLRSIASMEGRMIEQAISLIAAGNPELIVLTENLRLPLTKAAIELVDMNDPTLFKSISLDADSSGRKSYKPDLILLNRVTKIAHVVDIKRSLIAYDATRIHELKKRMLAAALVVPDLLYREHNRLQVSEVRAVLLDASNQRTDVDGSVWPVSCLDHLVEVNGAAMAIETMRKQFSNAVDDNWSAALQEYTRPQVPIADVIETNPRGSMPLAMSDSAHLLSAPVKIGFAQGPIGTRC